MAHDVSILFLLALVLELRNLRLIDGLSSLIKVGHGSSLTLFFLFNIGQNLKLLEMFTNLLLLVLLHVLLLRVLDDLVLLFDQFIFYESASISQIGSLFV